MPICSQSATFILFYLFLIRGGASGIDGGGQWAGADGNGRGVDGNDRGSGTDVDHGDSSRDGNVKSK